MVGWRAAVRGAFRPEEKNVQCNQGVGVDAAVRSYFERYMGKLVSTSSPRRRERWFLETELDRRQCDKNELKGQRPRWGHVFDEQGDNPGSSAFLLRSSHVVHLHTPSVAFGVNCCTLCVFVVLNKDSQSVLAY